MKLRKSKEIKAVLLKKGFELNPKKEHHEFYYLVINGKKQHIYTYFSHGKKDYDKTLLSLIKKQLKFESTENFENFLDCPFTKENYKQMLIDSNNI
jgi:predicted RNA binding protein YcfA (HicA-like mRNA interferase family)